jgi:hypothetical protein
MGAFDVAVEALRRWRDPTNRRQSIHRRRRGEHSSRTTVAR